MTKAIKTLSKFCCAGMLLLSACGEQLPTIELLNTNLNEDQTYILCYEEAYEKGFVIPNYKQDGISSFQLTFKVEHFNADTLYYKLFYQNESYKFDEQHELAGENFYGSSEATLDGFAKVVKTDGQFIIEDELMIKGNPRNERKYFGRNPHLPNAKRDTTGFSEQINAIKNSQSWYDDIVKKAEANKISVDEQLKLDALWLLANSSDAIGASNNRWKRNPRMGRYSLMLVVTDKIGAGRTANHFANITQAVDNQFVHPYPNFTNNKEGLYAIYQLDSFLTIKAEVPLERGIYVPFHRHYTQEYLNKYVHSTDEMYLKAAMEIQETSLHDKVVENVPVKAKFLTGNYTKEEYVSNSKKYNDKRVKINFTNTHEPGKTFGIDTIDNSLWFKNPYYENEYRKENVGVKTRHGMSYGKYTFKIKMANLLSKDNVWTGLTNALWLVKESGDAWNNRRTCQGEGFMPYYGAPEGEQRVPQISYSEIDFEILKTAETWPWTSYVDKKEHNDPPSNDDKVMVTCTNWDMACMQPKNFGIGVQKSVYEGQEFYPHRWNEFYNALTAKWPEKDTELFGGEYYYFQIEWKPKEIIWRLGSSKDKLRVVCYMNDEITTIPNNQMIALITQEYHFAEWWPKSPYKQGNVPFPGEDLKGRLYSLEIE